MKLFDFLTLPSMSMLKKEINTANLEVDPPVKVLSFNIVTDPFKNHFKNEIMQNNIKAVLGFLIEYVKTHYGFKDSGLTVDNLFNLLYSKDKYSGSKETVCRFGNSTQASSLFGTTAITRGDFNVTAYIGYKVFREIAPINASPISCGETSVGKFTGGDLGPSKIFLSYLITKVIQTLFNGTRGSGLIDVTFVEGSSTYDFYYKRLQQYNLASLSYYYVNTNTKNQLNKVIFYTPDLAEKLCKIDFTTFLVGDSFTSKPLRASI